MFSLGGCCYCLVAQSYQTLLRPHGLAHQASLFMGFPRQILEWVATSYSRGSLQSRDHPCVSCSGRKILYHWATREAPFSFIETLILYLLTYFSSFCLIWIYILEAMNCFLTSFLAYLLLSFTGEQQNKKGYCFVNQNVYRFIVNYCSIHYFTVI